MIHVSSFYSYGRFNRNLRYPQLYLRTFGIFSIFREQPCWFCRNRQQIQDVLCNLLEFTVLCGKVCATQNCKMYVMQYEVGNHNIQMCSICGLTKVFHKWGIVKQLNSFRLAACHNYLYHLLCLKSAVVPMLFNTIINAFF